MKEFLCLIIEKSSGKEITELRLKAIDEFSAKDNACRIFNNNKKYIKRYREFGANWYVDSCEI